MSIFIKKDESVFTLGRTALVRRILNAAQLSEHIVATQKAQARKKLKKIVNKKQNKKTVNSVAKVRAKEKELKDKPSEERKILHQKVMDKAKIEAVKQAQKTAKDRRKNLLALAGKKVPPKPPRTRLTAEEKNQVKMALKNAAERMANTENIPHRKDKFSVGGSAYSSPLPFSRFISNLRSPV